ncbi:sugar transferase [Rhodoflexus caldus]|uniref:sugar transferase n=1 Tax=Rhodoflexus caldus TaxID=2891236 RepID=UPI00202A5EC2|nr:sugar transferase [Rhodoflexus caldus]
MYQKFFKPLIDKSVALVALLLLSPVFLLITVVLFIANRGKPFFFQERPGLNERPFRVIKFKTMNDKKDANGQLLPNHLRTTKIGAFLRATSLDEIPQLINVLKGDMSLVGPRPLLFKYIPLYSPEQRRRHLVKPGITGWAQVNGRNAISWTKKFEYDVYYVDHCSFALDMKILWLTVRKVLKREGVNVSKNLIVEPFNGTN